MVKTTCWLFLAKPQTACNENTKKTATSYMALPLVFTQDCIRVGNYWPSVAGLQLPSTWTAQKIIRDQEDIG